MDANILPRLFEAKVSEPLITSFEKLTDSRMKRGIRYKLKPLVILLFLSKLGGADSPAEIADWVNFRFGQMKFSRGRAAAYRIGILFFLNFVAELRGIKPIRND